MATELASAYLALIPSLNGAQKKIESQLDGMNFSSSGKKMGTSITSGIGSAFSTVAKVGIGAVASIGTAVAGLAVGGGISRALKIDQAQFKFKALGMDVAETMASANEAVAGTAFGLDAAATVATQLGASGVASGEAMTGALKSIAGVAAMSGRSMEDIGSIFSKVAAKGKVSGDEILQLNEAGINATSALAKHLGKTSAEVSDMVSKGQIDFATFSAAMQETFGEAAAGANETFQGASSNIMAALSRIGAKFAAPALDGLRQVFVALIPAIDKVSKALDPLVETFTGFVTAVAGRAVSGINTFTEALTETGSVIDAIGFALADAFDGTRIGNVVGAFTDALGMGSGAATAFRESLFQLFNGTALQPVADALMQPFISWQDRIGIFAQSAASAIAAATEGTSFSRVGDVINAFSDAMGMGSGAASAFRESLFTLFDGTALQPIADALESPFLSFSERLSIFGTSASAAFATVVENIKGVVAGLPQPVQDAIANVVSTFQNIAGFVTPLFTGLIDGVKGFASAFAGAFSGSDGLGMLAQIAPVLMSLTSPLGIVKMLFSTFGEQMTQLANTVGSSLVPLLTMLGGHLGNMIAAVLPSIVSAIGSLLPVVGQIVTAVTQIVQAVLPVVISLMQQLSPFIEQIAGMIGQVVAALAPMIAQLISALLPVITQVIQVIMNVVQAVMPAVIAILNVVMAVIQALLPIIMNIISVVVSVVSAIISAIGAVITVVGNVVAVIASAVSSVISVVGAILTTVIDVFGLIAGVVTDAIATVASVISTGFSTASAIVSDVCNAIGSVVGALFGAVSGFFNSIASSVTSAVQTAFSVASSTFDSMLSAISSVCGNIYGVVSSGFSQAVGYMQGLASQAWNWGADIIQGIIDGITSMIGGIADAAGNIADTIASFLHFSEPDVGSLSNFHTFMPDMMKGLAKGMLSNLGVVRSAVSSVAGEMADGLAIDGSVGLSVTPYNATGGLISPANLTAVEQPAARRTNDDVVAQIAALRDELGQIIRENAPVLVQTPRQARIDAREAIRG